MIGDLYVAARSFQRVETAQVRDPEVDDEQVAHGPQLLEPTQAREPRRAEHLKDLGVGQVPEPLERVELQVAVYVDAPRLESAQPFDVRQRAVVVDAEEHAVEVCESVH